MGGVIIEGLEGTGVVQKSATLVASKGTYFLVIDGVRKAIPASAIPVAALDRLVGKEVNAVCAGRNIVAITGQGIKPPRWTCYIPVPDLFKRMQKDVQKAILDRFVEERVIPKVVRERILNGL